MGGRCGHTIVLRQFQSRLGGTMGSDSRYIRLWFGVLLSLSLVLVACGGDDDDAAGGDAASDEESSEASETDEPDTNTANAEGSGGEQTEDEAEGEDGAEDETEDAEAEPGPTEEVVLTDSFRGVTAETIKLGHANINFDFLNESMGLDLAFTNFEPMLDAMVAYYNEQGGVLGRQLEVVHGQYLPVGATTAEEVCLKFTADDEVFAVLNGFAGPGAENSNECIVFANETILVGGLLTKEQGDRAGGLWVSEVMGPDRRLDAGVNLLAATGYLDELGPIMVVASDPSEEHLVEQAKAAFEAAGASVPVTTFNTAAGDEPATDAEVDVFIERARSEGVESVFLIGEGEHRNGAFFRKAPDFTYVMANGSRLTDWQSIPPAGLEAGTRVITNTDGPEPSR